MAQSRAVTVIAPTINPITHLSKIAVSKRRTAGYARVSTEIGRASCRERV